MSTGKERENIALFLDRDGVVNVDKNYVHKIEEVEFIEGIFEFCLYFQQKGYAVFIITNQAGIARGFYTAEDFNELSNWMIAQFKEHGVEIKGIYFCPHHPDITGPCLCRKPEPGMILKAAEEHCIALDQSILVGNNESDLKAGENAGIQRNYLFRSSGDFKRIIEAEQFSGSH